MRAFLYYDVRIAAFLVGFVVLIRCCYCWLHMLYVFKCFCIPQYMRTLRNSLTKLPICIEVVEIIYVVCVFCQGNMARAADEISRLNGFSL